MKRVLSVASLLFVAPALTLAQAPNFQSRAQGYLFYGIGGGRSVAQIAGGGAAIFLTKGLAFEVEPAWARLGKYHNHTFLGCADFAYHLRRRARRGQVDPFVALGYTAFVPATGGFYDSGGNIAAGVNVWMRAHAALRLELRHYVNARTSGMGEPHLTAFRIGLTFR